MHMEGLPHIPPTFTAEQLRADYLRKNRQSGNMCSALVVAGALLVLASVLALGVR